MEKQTIRLKSLVGENKMGQVFEELLGDSLLVPAHLRNEIVLQSREFTHLQYQQRKHLLSNEEYDRGLARIGDNLLQLIDQLSPPENNEPQNTFIRPLTIGVLFLSVLALAMYLFYFTQSTLSVDDRRSAFDIAGIILLILFIIGLVKMRSGSGLPISVWTGFIILIAIWNAFLFTELINNRQIRFRSADLEYEIYQENITDGQILPAKYLGTVGPPGKTLKVRVPVGEFVNFSFKSTLDPEYDSGDILTIPRFWIP
ncbi:MAG: hypothetical protein R2824_35780, partial [Saprospiraceae bacterium]